MGKGEDGRRRVIIEGVKPQIDGGRFPIKRTIGEQVVVEADVFTDGHDAVTAVLCYAAGPGSAWQEVEMEFLGNDHWRATFTIEEFAPYRYTIVAWVDEFKTWVRDFEKRLDAGQDVTIDREIGARLIDDAVARATGRDVALLATWAGLLRDPEEDARVALDQALRTVMHRHANREWATTYCQELRVDVDRIRGRFSTWYELFPRSASPVPDKHGTFRDVQAQLPAIREMGFDVLYLPPIHPIGTTFRKGKNNSVTSEPGEPGSPWAIGSPDGGHKSIHPELGTLEDFRQLVESARSLGIDIALDIAFQCSPDHPYVKEHPEWFRHRPDGTIQYAENPPKKYQDIYPLNFETEDWRALWAELESIFLYWCQQGVRAFRVDNPHTKPFAFWEWVIGRVREQYPETIFLSEAFTRPRVLYRLAKLGFTQSYNYFAWRNTRWELTEYLTELTKTEVKEYCRPNFWPNTPDILTEVLQTGGRPAFISRVVLAGTLSSCYGIYGPAYELMEHLPLEQGKEEYLNSEKYEIRNWDLDRPDSLRPIITLLNRARHDNPALQSNDGLEFHETENEALIAYSKVTPDRRNAVLTVVNLDPYNVQSGWVHLDPARLGVRNDEPFQVHDLLGGGRYIWHGPVNYVELNPSAIPAHIFRIRHRVRTEHDFEYFV